MAWAVRRKIQFGQFFPKGEWVGWDEASKKYLEEDMSDAEKAKLNPENLLNSYLSFVSKKFRYSKGVILDHEWPEEFRTDKTMHNLGAIFALNDGVLVVEGRLKSIIENLEPNIHRFNPVKIVSPKKKVYAGDHFVLVIGQLLSCFSASDSDPDLFRQRPGDPPRYDILANVPGELEKLAVDVQSAVGKHLWKEEYVNGLDFFVSDKLRAAIDTAGIKLPPNAKMKSV